MSEEKYADVDGPFNRHKGNSAVVVDFTCNMATTNSTETTVCDQSDLYYDMTGSKTLIIFNQYMFKKTRFFGNKQPKTRNGTDGDVKRLNEVFSALGFKVEIHHDLHHDRIIDVIHEVAKRDHRSTSCVAVAVLSHGASGGDVYAADKPYALMDIITPFHNAKCNLVNKPKLFFVQACRGDELDSGVALDDQSRSTILPSHADVLILCSSAEDHVSFRDSRGSWLIQDLCSILEKHSKNMDILQIITLVNRAVAFERTSYNYNPVLSDKKQMPETRFTLTKILKFCP